MIGKNNAVTFSTKGQGLKIKLFEFLVYLEPVVFLKHHKRQGRNMVYGLRAQSPKYDWDQGSEERAQGSVEWDQGSQGF